MAGPPPFPAPRASSVAGALAAYARARPLTRGRLSALGLASLLALVALFWGAALLARGRGFGVPAAWGLVAVDLVWWAGLFHAGLLISAVLLLLRQDWRASSG